MKTIRQLFPYIRPIHHFLPEYMIYIVIGIVFGLVNFSLLIPILNILFDNAAHPAAQHPAFEFSISYFINLFNYHFYHLMETRGKMQALFFVCLLILLSTALSNAAKYMSARVLMRLRFKVLERLRNNLFARLLTQSISYYNKSRKGDLLNVITNEVQEIETSLLNSLQIWLRDPFIIIGYFIALFYISTKLTLFTLIFFPVSGLIVAYITKRLKRYSWFSQDLLAKILGFTDENITGIRIIQSFGAVNHNIGRFRDINNAFSRNSKKMFAIRELTSPISETLGVLIILVLVLYGGRLLLGNQSTLTGSMFITYLALYSQILPSLKNLSGTTTAFQRGLVASEKIFSVLNEPALVLERSNAVQKTSFTDSISISNVSFSYDSAPVLHEVNLTIPKGKIIALVGASGSGKSTLADLICRFYDPTGGAILIDGQDLRDLQLASLRSLIGIVSQEPILFHDTIFNNIALGQPDAQLDDVIRAAKTANAHEFIESMEAGYESVIGDRGMKLSGGQRQRLTIARAIFKDPDILILDEATSSLDTESERLVQDAINKMMENRTSVVIAHRLSTIRHADEIIVLQKGNIVERGSHDQLLAAGGVYKRLVDMQEVK